MNVYVILITLLAVGFTNQAVVPGGTTTQAQALFDQLQRQQQPQEQQNMFQLLNDKIVELQQQSQQLQLQLQQLKQSQQPQLQQPQLQQSQQPQSAPENRTPAVDENTHRMSVKLRMPGMPPGRKEQNNVNLVLDLLDMILSGGKR